MHIHSLLAAKAGAPASGQMTHPQHPAAIYAPSELTAISVHIAARAPLNFSQALSQGFVDPIQVRPCLRMLESARKLMHHSRNLVPAVNATGATKAKNSQK